MKLIILCLVVIIIITIVARFVFAAEAKENFDKVIPAKGIESLTLSNTNGAVEVLAGTDDNIEIHAIKKVSGMFEKECKSILADLQIEITVATNTIEIKHSRYDFKMMYNRGIEYTIKLPPRIQVKIETTNGSINCKNRTANGEFVSTNGEIEISEFTGNVRVETTNGAIHADCKSNNAKFETTNGGLRLKVDLSDNGDLSAETTNGAVKLSLPKTVSARLTAETTNGKVSADDFESAMTFNRGHTEAHGKLGTGNGRIRVESTNGSISIASF